VIDQGSVLTGQRRGNRMLVRLPRHPIHFDPAAAGARTGAAAAGTAVEVAAAAAAAPTAAAAAFFRAFLPSS